MMLSKLKITPLWFLRTILILGIIPIPYAVIAQDGDENLLAPTEVLGEAIYVPFSVDIEVDGDLSDWQGVPVQHVDRGSALSDDPDENGSFTFAVAANPENIFIYMTMPDQNIIAGEHGLDYWNEDSFEFYLNLSGDLATNTYKQGIYQININATNIGNTDPTELTLTGVNSADITVEGFVFETENGWGVEIRVPMTVLGIEPMHGLEIGFQAQANGASEHDRNVKLIWSNADELDTSWQNPNVFGRALFFEIDRDDIPIISTVESEDSTDIALVDDPEIWHELVVATWEGYKNNYIFCGADCGDNLGLVFDPNIGYQAVSEGVGYGMLMAVMMDDQATFDIIYDAAYEYMLDPRTGLLNWRVDNTGSVTGQSSATDAEEDIAVALIFAQKRVERGEWEQHEALPYNDHALEILDAIYLYEVADEGYLTPGDGWRGDGQEIMNLSYFMPAWYRIYDDFEGGDRWNQVLTYGYRSLYQTDGAELGLAPDWSTADGQPAFEYCEANNRPLDACRYEMTFDAIRVPWRIGLDCLWFGEPLACDWSQRTAEFLKTLSPNQFARLYDMSGQAVVDYQNEMMIGMWLVPALAAEDTDLQTTLAELLFGFGTNALSEGYWAGTTQYYYNQSLAWFGASLLSGDFRNLYAAE